MRIRMVITVTLVILLLGSMAGAVASIPQASSTVNGVSVGDASKIAGLNEDVDDLRDEAESAGLDPGTEASVILADDGSTYVVFNTEGIEPGSVTIYGYELPSDHEISVMVATEHEHKSPIDLSYEEFDSDPSAYEYETIEMDASIAIGSTVFQPEDAIASQSTVATIDEPGSSLEIDLQYPGQLAQWASVNLTDTEDIETEQIDDRLPEGEYVGASFDEQFWGSGETTVEVAVLPPTVDIGKNDLGPDRTLYIVDVEYKSESMSVVPIVLGC